MGEGVQGTRGAGKKARGGMSVSSLSLPCLPPWPFLSALHPSPFLSPLSYHLTFVLSICLSHSASFNLHFVSHSGPSSLSSFSTFLSPYHSLIPLSVFPLLSLPVSLSVNLPLFSLSPPPLSHVSVVRLSARERMERGEKRERKEGEDRGGDRDQWRASRRGVAMLVVALACDPTPLRHNGLGQTDRQPAE